MNWQPIDTAPRDGTIVLGCEWVNKHNREHIVAEVMYEAGAWYLASTCWPDESLWCEPSHWMPRPPPPLDTPPKILNAPS